MSRRTIPSDVMEISEMIKEESQAQKLNIPMFGGAYVEIREMAI